jgi:hypothetical protein
MGYDGTISEVGSIIIVEFIKNRVNYEIKQKGGKRVSLFDASFSIDGGNILERSMYPGTNFQLI